MSERYYIYHADDINAQLCDTESDFNIHVDEILNEELLIQLCNLLNEKQKLIEEKSNVIILMGAFIKSKGFSIDDFDEWISMDWHNVNEIRDGIRVDSDE